MRSSKPKRKRVARAPSSGTSSDPGGSSGTSAAASIEVDPEDLLVPLAEEDKVETDEEDGPLAPDEDHDEAEADEEEARREAEVAENHKNRRTGPTVGLSSLQR